MSFYDSGSDLLYYAIYPSAESAPTWDRSTGWSNTPTKEGSQAAGPVGVIDWDSLVTDLTAETSYRVAFVWDDGADTSSVVVSDAFVTLAGGITGTGTLAIDDVTTASAVSVDVSGDSAVSVDAVTVSSAAAAGVSGDSSITLDAATLASTASAHVDASAAITLDAATVSATIPAADTATAQAEITLDGVSVSSAAAVAVDASADLAADAVGISALASALAEAESAISLEGATVSSEVFGEGREASAEITLEGFSISSVIGDLVQVGGGGSKSRPRKPRGWEPKPYERKGLDKISEAARKRRLIEAAKAEDEYLLTAVKQLLVEAA